MAFDPEICLSDPCESCAIAALPTQESRAASADLAATILRQQGDLFGNLAVWELPDVVEQAETGGGDNETDVEVEAEVQTIRQSRPVRTPARALEIAAAIYVATQYDTPNCPKQQYE